MSSTTIVTHRKRIPWSWAFFICLPWVGSNFLNGISNDPLTFTMRKFSGDPVVLTAIASVNTLFNFMVGMIACYFSDRIWTSFGRRKPFLVTGFLGSGVVLFFVPLVSNFTVLIIAIIAYQFIVDFGKPWEPLYNEVIPPKQRGRAGIFRMILVNAGGLLLNTTLVGQFDQSYDLPTPIGTLTGEQVTYWTVALIEVGMGLLLWFVVKETKPPSLPGEADLKYRPTPIPGVQWTGEARTFGEGVKQFVADMFASRQAWYVYMLYACPVIAGAATNNPNRVLFMVDQLEVTKRTLGDLHLFSMPFTIVLFTPFAGFLADRLPRVWMLMFGITVPALIQLGFIGYLRWYNGYEFDFMLFWSVGVVNSFFNAFLVAVWGPVIYDYIPSRRMGTYAAGFTIIGGAMQFGLINVSGFWVKWWTRLFGVPGYGEYDFSSIFVLDVLFTVFSVTGCLIFLRAVRKGIVRPEGVLEMEQAENGPVAEA